MEHIRLAEEVLANPDSDPLAIELANAVISYQDGLEQIMLDEEFM